MMGSVDRSGGRFKLQYSPWADAGTTRLWQNEALVEIPGIAVLPDIARSVIAGVM